MDVSSASLEAQVAAQKTRVRELEAELSAARAALEVSRARVLARQRAGVPDTGVCAMAGTAPAGPLQVLPHTGPDISASSPAANRPAVLLQPLPLHDSLRRKWKLGAGLPLASGALGIGWESAAADMPAGGVLRIYGMLCDGSPWECEVPFSSLVKEGGVVIGRDARMCEVALEDESVSRMHARLEINHLGLVVSDVNSMNGVFVNSTRVDYHCPQLQLTDGAVLTLGEVPLRVELIFST